MRVGRLRRRGRGARLGVRRHPSADTTVGSWRPSSTGSGARGRGRGGNREVRPAPGGQLAMAEAARPPRGPCPPGGDAAPGATAPRGVHDAAACCIHAALGTATPDACGGRGGGGAMGGLLGPADGFYQWLGEGSAPEDRGAGVPRVGWRRPNDVDLCTLDLLAAADLAARAGAGLHHGRPRLRRRHRGAGGDGDGVLGAGVVTFATQSAGCEEAGGLPRRCSPSTATTTRSCRWSRARRCARWSGGRAELVLCEGRGTSSPRRTPCSGAGAAWVAERLGVSGRRGAHVDPRWGAGSTAHRRPAAITRSYSAWSPCSSPPRRAQQMVRSGRGEPGRRARPRPRGPRR